MSTESRARVLANLFRRATPPFLVSYHGTDARWLPSIMADGLKAQKPGGTADKGVYLTNDMEKAARYAVEGTWSESSRPMILEVRLSKQKRVKRVYRDNLDREESNLFDGDQYEDEDLADLERSVKAVLDIKWGSIPREVGLDFETYGDPSALSGLNLYKPLLAYARKQGWNIQQFKQKLFHHLTPGDTFGPWEITNDGTLTLDQDAYDGMHQQVYPDNLPPSTIKAVWLSGVPEGTPGERMTIQSKLLPQEVRRIIETFGRVNTSNIFQYDLSQLERVVDNLEEKDEHGIFTDVVQEMRSAVEGAPEGDDDALMEAREVVADALENIQASTNEMYYNPPGGKRTGFVKMSPQQAMQMVQQPVTASGMPWLTDVVAGKPRRQKQGLSQNPVTSAILQVREQYLASGEVASVQAVNQGLCEEFTNDVWERAEELAGRTLDISVVGTDCLEDDDGDYLDRESLEEAGLALPDGMDPENLYDVVGGRGHVWITFEGRHYDAECPQGVQYFTDLPIFKR
jgi:hypothetical protein